MKRSLMIQMGVFSVSLFLSTAALAQTSCQFSTGPLENATGLRGPNQSEEVFVKILNNNVAGPLNVAIQAFSLDGAKTPIPTPASLFGGDNTIDPGASDFMQIMLPDNTVEFVVEVEVAGTVPGALSELALVSVWGKDSAGNLVPAHRVSSSELIRGCELIPHA